jgi:hypothetical protein
LGGSGDCLFQNAHVVFTWNNIVLFQGCTQEGGAGGGGAAASTNQNLKNTGVVDMLILNVLSDLFLS